MKYESSYVQYYGVDPYNPGNTAEHHGIIGMKWGVWNPETRARYLGTNKQKSKNDQVGTKDHETLLKDGKAEFDKEYINLTKHKYKNPDMQGWSMKKYTTMKEARDAYAEEYAKNKEKKINTDKTGKAKLSRENNSYRYQNSDYIIDMPYPHDKKTSKRLQEEFKKYPYTLDDLPKSYHNLIKEYGLSKNDVFINNEGHVMRKDGEPFLYEYVGYDGKIDKRGGAVLDGLAEAWDRHYMPVIIKHSDFSNNSYYAVDSSDHLKQHGIIGMKWGVWNEETRRRYLGGGSKSKWFTNPFKSNNQKEDPHLKRTHLTKELAEISDEELKAAVARMQLEQNYLNYLEKYPDASSKGKKYANQFSDELFKNLSTSLGGALGKRISEAIDDWINGGDDKKYWDEADSQDIKKIKEYNEAAKAKTAYVGYRKKEDKR